MYIRGKVNLTGKSLGITLYMLYPVIHQLHIDIEYLQEIVESPSTSFSYHTHSHLHLTHAWGEWAQSPWAENKFHSSSDSSYCFVSYCLGHCLDFHLVVSLSVKLPQGYFLSFSPPLWGGICIKINSTELLSIKRCTVLTVSGFLFFLFCFFLSHYPLSKSIL